MHGTQHLTVKVEGVVIPSWLAIVFAVIMLASIIPPILSIDQDRKIERELRILQVHTQDIENVLIRRGLAKREDFAPWEAAPDNEQTAEE